MIRDHWFWIPWVRLVSSYDFRRGESWLLFYPSDSPSDKSDDNHQYQKAPENKIAQIAKATLDDLFVIYRIWIRKLFARSETSLC